LKLTLPILAVIVIVVCCLALFVLAYLSIDVPAIFSRRFGESVQPLIALSVSLAIFPIITVPLVGEIVSKARDLGIRVSKSLVEDYVNGCFTIFILSIAELILVFLITVLETIVVLYYLVIALLASILLVLAVLMLSLWKIVKLLYEIIATQ